ncbi:MAG TPA: tetratricopeptide repeat protein [Terriglobales bacterium]|jgi:tetratricopeptide (TPR) repeat protein|nr:tetratricopeptide repeat protein [Terriglobales bacterium]
MAKSADTQLSGAGQPLWIYNPGLDLVVGCGAWSLPLLLLTYFTTSSSTLAWSVAFYGLALFFNYPHYMATIYRAYHRAEDFEKYRIFTVHITALVALTLLVSHFWFRALPWIFTLYLTWSPWHYSGQNYGLFMMFARRAGAKPSTAERRALYAAFLLSYLILFLSFHTGPSRDPLFLSLGIPGRFSSIAVLPLSLGFVLLSAYGLSALAEQVGWRPLLPSLTLFSTQFVWFLLPTALSFGERLQIPQSRYSTGVLAVMHSAQYLWITSYYARRESSADNAAPWRPLAYFGLLIVGGIALFVPGPWLASRVFHYDFTSSFLIFTALVNIHHFILDGAIWKLRDGRIAALLLNSRERLASAKAEAGSQVAAGLRWIVGSAPGAHALRVSAVLLLLAVGTVDQVRYYFALHSDNLADLQRAVALDAYDSSVQTRLGHKQLEGGNTDEAVAAWQQAVRTNPADPAPRNALLKYLTGQKRFDEAYQLTRQSLRYAPKDADLLVNHGILAEQLGHPEEALDSWTRALRLDPSQWRAHLYLADELDREGKAETAIPHYVIFLDKASQLPDRPPAAELITTVLRLAQCQVRANRPDQAENSYALALRLASQSGEKKLESFASVSNAELEAVRGKIPEALLHYQRALRLDSSLGDRRSEAADWYEYGLFLRDSGFSPRLAYASLLHSESLMEPFKDAPEFRSIVQAREETENKLAGAAGPVRRNPKPALDEALAVSMP